ncbi:MAG: S1 RNA-binding domain-containing protein [Bacillota bacterium]
MSLEVGSIVEGIVSGITHFGAFISLPSGETGLVHISEIADTYVKEIGQFLKENDKVLVKVLSIDGKKIGLSIRQANPTPRPAPETRRRDSLNFEDRLTRFMKESEDRMTDLRRAQNRRNGGGRSYRSGH